MSDRAKPRDDGLRADRVDPRSDARWETYVAGQADALVYHHPAWLEVLQRAYGHDLVAFACETEDGELCGALALFRTRGLLTGRRLSSLPHTPRAGPLASNDAATAALLRAAIEEARACRAHLQIKASSANLGRLVEGLTAVPWEATYIMELPDVPERLRFGNARNNARIKWAVNKAIKAGVRVRLGETEAELRAWYELYLETMRDHVVPPRPYRFFKAMWDVLGPRGMVRLLLAEEHHAHGRRLLAGSVFLCFGSTVLYAFTGGSHQDLRLRPNDVIQWTALHDACRDGFRRYDFGEVGAKDPGLARFKSKWGAQPSLLYRYYYPAPGRAERRVPEFSRIRRVGRGAWQRVPIGVTELLGDRVYR